MPNSVLITKANGVMEPFNVEKLQNSLLRSGATPDQAESVISNLVPKIKPGDSTVKIYRQAFQVLKKTESSIAARYSLRRSLSELGPSGFPFEIFISELFRYQGYETVVGAHLRGKCIDHEVDLIAWNDQEILIGEVKFHNNSDLKNDAKTILYVNSRYQDLLRSNFDGMNPRNLESKGWLITNTKFTQTTINYANCSGMKLLGWNYPYNDNCLQSLVERSGLIPITALTTLTADQKRTLMNDEVVLCKYLIEHPHKLASIGLSKRKIDQVMGEAHKLVDSKKVLNDIT